MAEDNRNNPNRNERRTGDFRVPPRAWILWIVIIGTIPMLFLFKDRVQPTVDTWNYKQLKENFETGVIESGTITYHPQSPDRREVSGRFKKKDASGEWEKDALTGQTKLYYFRIKTPIMDPFLDRMLGSGRFIGR